MLTNLRFIKVLAVFNTLFFVGQAHGFDHTHAQWEKWLKKFVTVNGPVTSVDYKAAKASPELLKPYLQSLEAVTQAEYAAFGDAEKMTYLINSYNARTADLVSENYPIKSIKDLGGLFSSPWKKKFFKLFGEEQNLDYLEHGLLRKNWQEPRVHFAVNCASKGCPALRAEAFLAPKLEAQLEAAAKAFLSDTTRNRWDAAEGKFFLSKIFDWYGEDFVKKAGSVQSFVSVRMAASPIDAGKMAKGSIAFLDYDWTLNETLARTNASKN